MATSKFGSAFAAARKSGAKTFEFEGKKFTAETKEEARDKAGSAVSAKYEALRKAPAGADTAKMRSSADAAARKFSGVASTPASAPKDTSRAQAAGLQFAKMAKAEAGAKGASEATRKAMAEATAGAKRKYETEAAGLRKGGKVKPKKRMI